MPETLYLNLIVPPVPERLATRVERTVRAVFAWCATHRSGDSRRWHNLLLACRRTVLDGDRTIYEDYGPRGEVDVCCIPRRFSTGFSLYF